MDNLKNSIQKVIPSEAWTFRGYTNDEPRPTEADIFNSVEGKLKGYDCSICRNKGVVYRMNGEELVSQECECMKARRSIERINTSGLKNLIANKSFDNFEVDTDYQRDMRDLCVEFVQKNGRCLFLGGQAGIGKTHLCTAVCSELLHQNKEVRYMQWREDVPKLKSIANQPEYVTELKKLKTVEVLYIDDLYKTDENAKPTAADINIVFDIINYRYINSGLITILSTNRTFMELMTIDEATASRIIEMCGKFVKIIKKGPDKNYRYKIARRYLT